jgi:O-antigen ligase
VKNLPAGRIFDIAFSDQTVQTRLWTWGSAWKGFLERPLLGWGAENFGAVFDKYFDPRHFIPGQNTETWFDRAHSVYFDYLAETGILGFLSYLSIFGVIYWEFFRKKERAGDHSVLSKALIFSLPLGYLVQGAAIFEVLPMYINLFLFFAFCHYYFYSSHSDESR